MIIIMIMIIMIIIIIIIIIIRANFYTLHYGKGFQSPSSHRL